MNSDSSLMKERLAYYLFRSMGIAAPDTVPARLVINGELVGLFLLVEQIDGRFTRSRFEEGGKGNLYKEIWPIHTDDALYLNALKTNEDENPSVDKMQRLRTQLDNATQKNFPASPTLGWTATTWPDTSLWTAPFKTTTGPCTGTAIFLGPRWQHR